MKTNLKGLLAVAKTIFSSSCTRFCVVLLSCLLWTGVGWGQTTQTFSYNGAIQTFTVPAGITSLTITATGAAGGGTGSTASSGGKGATLTGTFSVTPGHILNILVGQLPTTAGLYGGGGGGGTYVWNSTTSTLLIVGGGGGGGSYSATSGKDASVSTTPTATATGGGAGGTGTLGGSASATSGEGGGGAGWTGNGVSATSGGGGGLAPPTSTGGSKSSSGTKGGYGGGGGGALNGGGGGGGYAGGGGGKSSVGGGGGASYNAGTSTSSSVTNTGAGSVTITYTLPGCSGTPASASINSSASNICAGASASLSLSTSYTLSGITYQWKSSTTSGGPYTTNLGTAATQSTGSLSTTTYYVCTITCTNSSSSYTTPEAVVTVNQLPSVAVNSGTYCSGGTALTLTATGATSYAWSPSTGLSASSGTSVNANPTATTTYTVTGTAANGCVATATSTVTYVLTPSAISLTQSPASVCNGGVTTLTSTGGTISSVPSQYSFSTSSSTYSAITGTNLGSSVIGDDVGVGNIPIGFSFPYNGVLQTVFAASSNGLLLLGNSSSTISGYSGNALASTANIIAPLWDDNNTTGGSIIYSTTGTAPNRVLTVQWTGMHVAGTGSSTNPTIDMQVLLYENGIIKFLYGSQSATLSSPSASIGISGASGTYISVTTASPLTNSTVSSSAENTSINTNYLLSGTNLIFTPPPAVLSWSPNIQLYTNAAATTAYTGNSIATVYAFNSSATTYTLTATNGSCATSNTVTTSITPLPTITLGSASDVCSGTTSSSLTYSATTGSPDQYIIDYDATANVQGFTDITTYTTLTASPISLAVPANAVAGTYNGTLTVKNSSTGCVSSIYAFTVTVNGAVTISTQPASQVVLPNATATFSVSASGTGLSYQWQESIDTGATWNSLSNTGIYTGVTTNTLTLSGVTTTNSGYQYRVIVTGAAPCAALTSNAATLTISSTAITAQPQNQTICSNVGAASFSISTSGNTPTYQWQVSTNGGTSWTDIAGETNASLSLSGLTLSDSAKQYRCQLNSGAVISNVAILTVYGVPTINTQPSNLTVCSNATSGNFTVAATGSNLSYQWQRSTDAGATWSNISGATTNTLSFTSYTNAMDGYQYKVIVSGSSPCSTATSNVVTLNVTGILSVAASSATTCANSAITLTATPTTSASGLNYSWSSTTGSGATSAVTTNPASITPTAAGTYTYTLATTGGAPSGGCTFSNTVNVSVNSLPNSVTASSNNTTICLGSSINLTSVSSSSNLLNVIGDGGFETGATFPLNNWTVVNGSNNIWSVGSSAGVQAGSNAALIGTGNVATANASVNHFYRDIVIPVGSTNINLSFYLKMAIVDNTYDYLNVYTTTTSNIPVAGTLPSTGYTSVFSNTATVYSTFTSQSITLPNSLAGTTVRLVFTYKCDGVSPYSAPAVDNVSLSAIPASSYSWNSNPTGFTSSVQNPTGVSPTTNTTYTVTSTNSFGCTSSNSVSVTVNPTNTASTASSTPTLCANTALTAITHTTTGATGISSAGVSGANTLPAGVSATWANNTITISGTPTSAGTFNYSIPLTGGCGSVNATGTITVNALPTTSVLTGTLACAGSTGTISSSTSQSGVNYQLYDASNTAVGSAIAGTGSSLTWSSLPISNGYYVIGTNATSSCVSANSNAVAVGTITNKTWTGATSNDWSTASNWSCSTLPTSSDVIIINTSNPAPVMGADFTVGATGSLTISGTGSLIISPSKTLTIAGAVNFGGKSVTLKSDSVGTARIATITGSLTNATNVTQERYVPGKAVRKWSFLASPVTQSLASAWQQQIHITGPGTGGTMCNNYTISGTMTPHSNGFDVTQLQNPSFYTYDAATDNFVANTSGTNSFTLSPGNGYMVLVRGDRNDATNGGCVLLSANNQAAFTSIPVTLAATGAVGQGTITKVLPTGYSFIGNPYPCELDFPSFNTTNASVISGGYWTYYPTNATYTFSTYNNGTSTNGGTQVIANGQSFLVNSTSGGTITFNEAHKSTTANNGNFRLTKNWDELLRVGLLNNQSNRLDEVVIRFGNDAAITKTINEYDAASVNGGDQWIKTMKDATELAIQTRPNTYQNDTVSLAIHAKNAGSYQLGFSEYQGLSNTEVYLIDQQENLIQNVKALPSYDFSVAANTTTANRFKLIFNAKTSGIGNIASNTQLQVYPNPTKDKVSITCNSLEYGAYQVKVRTITGAEVLQAKGFYKNGDVIELSLNDLAAGMYLLELSQDNGFRATQKITKH